MKKVAAFFETDWVFGKIHYEMARAIYPHVQMDLLDWRVAWPPAIFPKCIEKYDYFMSTPQGCDILCHDYDVPLEKLIGITHGQQDPHMLRHEKRAKFYSDKSPAISENKLVNGIAGWAVVCDHLGDYLKNESKHGRPATTLPIGVCVDNYKRRGRNPELKVVGNFGCQTRMESNYNLEIIDTKRGYIAQSIAETSGLYYLGGDALGTPRIPWQVSESMYETVDIHVFTSTTEGNPMGLIESAACGIPTIGPRVGIMDEAIDAGFGFEIPLKDEDKMVADGVKIIEHLKNNPSCYQDASDRAYEWARSTRDWKQVAPTWISYFNNPK